MDELKTIIEAIGQLGDNALIGFVVWIGAKYLTKFLLVGFLLFIVYFIASTLLKRFGLYQHIKIIMGWNPWSELNEERDIKIIKTLKAGLKKNQNEL